MELSLETLAPWGTPKIVETRNGRRELLTAPATDNFWSVWKTNKNTLKSAGISVSKNRYTSQWEICWWRPLPEKIAAEFAATAEASRAVDTTKIIPAPEGLDYFPFQKAGIAYALERQHVLIGDDMGVGKTIQAIGIVNATKPRNVLVIAPASLKLNWLRETEKWLIHEYKIGVATPKSFPIDANYVIINYDIIGKYLSHIQSRTWDVVIVDEAHYIKNPNSKFNKNTGKYEFTTTRVKHVLNLKNVGKWVFLTGTPILNRPKELYTMLTKLDPDGLGKNYVSFTKKFCNGHRDRFGWNADGASNLPLLQQLLRERCMIRRMKSEVLADLPPKLRQIIDLESDEIAAMVEEETEIAAKYEEQLRQLQDTVALAKVGENEKEYKKAVSELKECEAVMFTEMAKVRSQLAEAKIPYVIEHIESAIEAGPVICFAHHHSVVDKLVEHFGRENVSVVTGKITDINERQKAVDDFQSGKTKLFIGTIKAAGVGLTLTASSHVIFAELDWTPGWVSQAEDRANRIGQKNAVLVQHLVFAGSLDARMVKRLVEKQEIIDAALNNHQVPPDDAETPITTVQLADAVSNDLDDLEEAANAITPEQVQLIRAALQILAANCDGALAEDRRGFNKFDSHFGTILAEQNHLTPKQAAAGLKLARKYRRQLPDTITGPLKLNEPLKKNNG